MEFLATCEHLALNGDQPANDPICSAESKCDDCWDEHWANCSICRVMLMEE